MPNRLPPNKSEFTHKSDTNRLPHVPLPSKTNKDRRSYKGKTHKNLSFSLSVMFKSKGSIYTKATELCQC